ncbi:MAG: hypothetical protein M0P61_00525 [Ignavibacteriaceae bacterium]|nr:hypothetical protein [Ignavibacteriaceae bacterium]
MSAFVGMVKIIDFAWADAAVALSKLADIASDAKITPVEKLIVKPMWDVIVVEGIPVTGTLIVLADSFSIPHVDYSAAYAALDTYLNTTLTVFADMTATTDITRADWNTAWKNYYDERTKLLNLIATTTKGLADTAQSTANGKNKITYSLTVPGTTANAAGDIWFQKNASEIIIGQWEGLGGTAWAAKTLDNAVIANLDVGKLTAGIISVAIRLLSAIVTSGRLETSPSSEVTTAVTIPTSGTVDITINDTYGFAASGTAYAEIETGLQAFSYTSKSTTQLIGCSTTVTAIPLAIGDTVTNADSLGLLSPSGLKVLNGIIKGTVIFGSTIDGGVITGSKFQTAPTGKRIIINGDDRLNEIEIYGAGGIGGIGVPAGYIYASGGDLYVIGVDNLFFSTGGDVDITAGSGKVIRTQNIISAIYGLEIDTCFALNSSGQITKVNNVVPTAKYVLIGDGTSFTPRLLALADLPAVTANKVLISDASGYVTTSTISNVALSYLDATSSIQTQLDGKAPVGTASASYNIVVGLRWNGATLEQKTRAITITNGSVTVGAESGWTAVGVV